MQDVPTPPQPRGRPRDPAKREAILAAAYELVLRHGYPKVTMEQIAATAGAGKQTIYRWWTTKAELVLDALEHWAEGAIDPPARGASATLNSAKLSWAACSSKCSIPERQRPGAPMPCRSSARTCRPTSRKCACRRA